MRLLEFTVFGQEPPLSGDYWLMKILSFSNLNEITK